MRDPGSAAAIRASRATDRALGAARETESRRVAATHSYRAFAAFRAQWQVQSQLAWSTDLRRNPSLFHILAMFLFGAAAWRSRLLVDRTRLTRVRLWGVLVGSGIFGVAGNLAVSMGPRDGPIQALAAFPTTTTLITVLANTALTLTYVSAGILLLRGDRDAWRSRLAPLASIGRMALTNYLMQSVAMSLLFLPYGLRLGHELQLWTYPLIGVAIFASHFPLSIWWLRRYRFGPVEWAWRTMTYGRLQPMRLADGQMTFGAEPSGTPE